MACGREEKGGEEVRGRSGRSRMEDGRSGDLQGPKVICHHFDSMKHTVSYKGLFV